MQLPVVVEKRDLAQYSDDCEFTSDAELYNDWISFKAKTTRSTYESILRSFQAFAGNVQLQQITKKLVRAWLESRRELGDRFTTLNKKKSCLSSLLGHAMRESYLTKNVCANIPAFKEDKERVEDSVIDGVERIMGKGDVVRMINSLKKKRDILLLKTAYALALRVHEVANIHTSHFTALNNGYYQLRVVGKNSKVRKLKVDTHLYAELRELQPDNGFIFQSQKGNKLSRPQCHRIIKKAVANCHLDERISFHWLRHSRISHLVNSGVPLEQVRDFAGHSDLRITSNYIHSNGVISSDLLMGV